MPEKRSCKNGTPARKSRGSIEGLNNREKTSKPGDSFAANEAANCVPAASVENALIRNKPTANIRDRVECGSIGTTGWPAGIHARGSGPISSTGMGSLIVHTKRDAARRETGEQRPQLDRLQFFARLEASQPGGRSTSWPVRGSPTDSCLARPDIEHPEPATDAAAAAERTLSMPSKTVRRPAQP